MRVFFDPAYQRLVYSGVPADEGYWDGHWADSLTAKDVRKPDRFVVGVTKKYLPKGAAVVDVGCGTARTVYGLHMAGYDAYGVDYAPSTVAALNRVVPELQISLGDARRLSFKDGMFDGVWSLGVVEHFYDGFDEIAAETARILKLNGYAFVTVPTMSPLRKLKARLGLYPKADGKPSGFYQFALPPETVITGFEKFGLDLVSIGTRGGFKGFKDEVGPLKPILQKLYDSKSTPLRAIRAGMDKILSPLTCHTRLYVFRKP